MSYFDTTKTLLCLANFFLITVASSTKQDLEMVQTAHDMLIQAMNWSHEPSLTLHGNHSFNGLINNNDTNYSYDYHYHYYDHQRVALIDCAKLYDQAESRLARLLDNGGVKIDHEDALAWLSGALTSHRTCLDGLKEKGVNEAHYPFSKNLIMVLSEALALFAKKAKIGVRAKGAQKWRANVAPYEGLLASWNPASSRVDIVVASDGSGDVETIQEAVDRLKSKAEKRAIVYIKAGVYHGKVEIPRKLQNVMFVGDGIGKTVVTGHRSAVDGDTTVGSATFVVFGDGFWARDMTFENTAGPQMHQAVALMSASDFSLFYRCSFNGYQDTLYTHSLRQFYRDCHISGTVDFIFGNAAVVLQNCDIFVRRPMLHQSNMITAQGRDNPYEKTGISIHGSRIQPDPDFAHVKDSFETFLGRPWKKYSRTVISKTDLDGLIHPRGWKEWEASFALSTLYYAEYMNTGHGASISGRVNWPGFHVLRNRKEVSGFSVRRFIEGEYWVTETGVPVSLEI